MINLRNILVPTDFSEFSEKAVLYGVSLAEQYGAKLCVLTVIDDRIYDDNLFTAYVGEEIRESRRKVCEEQLTKLVENIRHDHPRVEVEKALRFGITYAEIIQFASEQKTDLIIMGSHGRTGLAHLLIGSTTERVVRTAPCPVLTVRPKEHEFVKD